MPLLQHRNTEILGGIINLLTIDASSLTGNAAHVRRYVNNYGSDGTGVTYQSVTYISYPYEIKKAVRSIKSNKRGTKISISNVKGGSLATFVENVGGSLNGAIIREIQVYERFLPNGVEPNASAFRLRIDHVIDYLEQSDRPGELIIHTKDPLLRDINVPTIAFSAGIVNDPTTHINVFPAADRSITEGR